MGSVPLPIVSDIDLSPLRRLADPHLVGEGVREGMKDLGPLIVPAMRQEMTHPDGPGARSLSPRVREGGGSVEVQVWGNAYLRFNLVDTRPHKIVARNARALRFQIADGSILFRRSVNHPGTKANRWDLRAWAAVRPEAVRMLASALIRRLTAS